jgi:hypothetical protein
VTLINSSDFSDITYSSDDGWFGVPIMFYKIFLDRNFEKRIADIPGWEIVYYAALNKLYVDTNYMSTDKGGDDDIKNMLAIIISKKPKVKNAVSAIPSFIFNSKYQADFIERLASVEII